MIRFRIVVAGALTVGSLVAAVNEARPSEDRRTGYSIRHRRKARTTTTIVTVPPTTATTVAATAPGTTPTTAATTVVTTPTTVATTRPATTVATTTATTTPPTTPAPTTATTAPRATTTAPLPPAVACSGRPSLVVGQFVDISPAGVQLGNGRFGVNDVQFAASDPCVLYAAIDQAGLYKSVNGGASWRKVGILDSPLHVRVNPRDPNHLYAVQGVRGATLGFWVSRDGGETWTMPPAFQSGSSLWTTDVSMVEVNPSDFNHLLITFHAYQWSNNNNGDTGVVESTDGGVTFTPHFQPGWGHGLWPMFVGDDPDHWLLGTSDHGYWRTTNGGASWTQVVVGDSMAHSGTQLYRSKANGALYMGTWNGILRSTDNGASWTKLGGDNGITYCSYYSVFGDGTTMFTQCAYTGTNARGREEPYLVSPENDGLNWAPYRGGAQTFINGPTWQTYDATNNILYSSNGSAGILAVKTR